MTNDALTRLTRTIRRAMQPAESDELPPVLVASILAAEPLPAGEIDNPSRIAPITDLEARTLEFALQEIPPHSASDMQRHAHESVHFVLSGAGYSEIGPRRCTWTQNDLVHTPVWAWHRHYNNGDVTVRMLIIENSKLLEAIGLHRRESAGLIDYGQLLARRAPKVSP